MPPSPYASVMKNSESETAKSGLDPFADPRKRRSFHPSSLSHCLNSVSAETDAR